MMDEKYKDVYLSGSISWLKFRDYMNYKKAPGLWPCLNFLSFIILFKPVEDSEKKYKINYLMIFKKEQDII
jgi:hypothetical protein